MLQRLSIPFAIFFLAWVGYAVVTVVQARKGPVWERCEASGNACGVILGFASPFLALALATSVFLLYRYLRIRRPIARTARRRPHDLVPSAGTMTDEVVGRRELCRVIAQSLRDRATRRPYLLVGGVGAGKTAVLVHLTQLLAQQGAVPVPLRLRDVGADGGKLDFGELAKRRFCAETDPGLLSTEQSVKVWRQLCIDGRAVVLADGLEEAFTAADQQADRDNLIRRAIQLADRQKLPLVIASRPHAPLEETEASIIDLEPLSEEAALDYLTRSDPDPDSTRLDWIVETAMVSESPLYMQLARQLRQHHLLEHLEKSKDWDQLDTRSRDRSMLRLRLLETWERALVDGHLREEVALPSEERAKTVKMISALACIGLLQDRLEVSFKELIEPADSWLAGAAGSLHREITELNGMEITRCESLLSLYTSRAEALGLVEAFGDRVRFPHSILQAYFGSSCLHSVGSALEEAIGGQGPGRELLIALVLRGCKKSPRATDGVAQLLVDAARERSDAKALDMYATALEYDVHVQKPIHRSIAKELLERWPKITSGDRRTLDEAKHRLVARFGEALREISRRRDELQRSPVEGFDYGEPAYAEFLQIAKWERSYSLRLGIAQEIGAGGDAAFNAIRKLYRRGDPGEEGDDPVWQYEQAVQARRAVERRHRYPALVDGPGAEERRERYRQLVRDDDEKRRQLWREFAARAWLVPMIVGSVGVERRGEAKERLDLWLKHLDPLASAGGRADLPISFEIALAQGFKSAANRRKRHPDTSNEAREYLIEQAETMLSRARFWFSQLTLIHALCLWELPDHTGRTLPEEQDRSSGSVRWRRPRADPSDAVQRWLTMAGSARAAVDRRPEDQGRRGERLHPFVARAADLAVLALETGRPEQYIWIDEKGAMENVGSSPGDPRFYRKHNLWIPSSVGWSTLDPRAQQLLGDVLLLVNLTERNGKPDELESRLERANRNSLPPCLAKDRSPLQPERTIGMAETAEPGNTCLRDCPFELCPYPSKGESLRAELREVFCRQQQALLYWHRGLLPVLGRKRAPWQGVTCKELSRFWEAMAARTRTPRS
ncbi:hypothetical protein GCM10009664_48900 [Kitasatospora gansuensis]